MVDDTKLLSRPLAAGVAIVGLFVALVVAVQLMTKVITFDYYPIAIYFTFVSNVVILPLFLFLGTRVESFKPIAIAWVHVSMSVMILYFSQIYSPFTAAWSILILIASSYYRWKGFLLSSFILVLTAAGYILLFPQNLVEYGGTLTYSFLSSLVILLTVFMSYLFVRVIMSSHKKNRELQQAQRSEQMQVNRLNTLLNSISDAVLTLNRYGRVTSQNAAAQAFFDTNESLVGRDIDKLFQLTDSSSKQVTVRRLMEETKSTSVRDDLSAGTSEDPQHLSVQISRIRSTFDDDEEYGVVLIIRDITKQKTLEEEKDEFISVTSHELRTPVAIAEGSLSNLLLMHERGIQGDKLKEASEAAHGQIVYLAKMINDLSTLSRAERGVGDVIEEIDVNEMLHNMYNKYLPEAEAKSLHLNLDAETKLPAIETSRLYLEEILQNFVTNAIKYTKEGSVTLGAKMEGSDKIKFFVTDTGIGISKPDLQHVFEKFYRSEDYRTRETSGTGLGLYVVRKLADKLDTRIDAQSRLNNGSTFSFVIGLKTTKFKNKDTKIAKPEAPASEERSERDDDTESEKDSVATEAQEPVEVK